MENILLAGATGYLGGYILKELTKQGFQTKAIVRNPQKLGDEFIKNDLVKIIKAEITQPDAIANCCDNIDVVISTVGITRQKDGLTYMDVDYQANLNLLNEAKRGGAKKFIYVSVLNGDKLRHLKICEAKEKFVDDLKQSGLNYCIIRPNGFYSDMTEFFNMAKKGRVYLFGNGELKANPIHGEDLAQICVDSINKNVNEIEVGGPEILTQNQIAENAFKTLNKNPKISHIPDWIRRFMLSMVRALTSPKVFGPIEFFLTVMAIEMVAPGYGNHRLSEYFNELNK
jgi:uncharacterized protein YbjT (DUF2867 family)